MATSINWSLGTLQYDLNDTYFSTWVSLFFIDWRNEQVHRVIVEEVKSKSQEMAIHSVPVRF